MKKIMQIYNTYGKGSGEELNYQELIEDTIEERKKIIEEYSNADGIDSDDDFINQKTDTWFFDFGGGDWDDPTGGFIVVTSYEEEKKRIEDAYKLSLEELEEFFRGGNK